VTAPDVGCTILVVDDDPDIRETTALVLELNGFTVIGASDGVEALRRLQEMHGASLVVLDMMMPTLTGEEVIAEMKRVPALAKIPVIVVSGDQNAAELARHLGADGCLRKPVTAAALLREVRRVVGRVTLTEAVVAP
jgi:CheY-like chemotaxis protein